MEFEPKTASEEYDLLIGDNSSFDETARYLFPLIEQALSKIKDKEIKILHEKNLKKIIPIAARRFLEGHKNEKDIKFSVYFTWYIHQEFENQK